MQSIGWPKGVTFMLGTCVVAASVFMSGCGDGDDPARAQSVPTDLSGVARNWDKNLPATQRFVVLSAFQDEAVRNNETGLRWERSPETAKVIWGRAKITCSNKNVGGRKSWRVPSVAELSSLVDPSVVPPGPTPSPSHPLIQSDRYWTATQDAVAPGGVWIVFFNRG